MLARPRSDPILTFLTIHDDVDEVGMDIPSMTAFVMEDATIPPATSISSLTGLYTTRWANRLENDWLNRVAIVGEDQVQFSREMETGGHSSTRIICGAAAVLGA